MQDFMAYYAEYGAVGVVIALFVWGYIKQGQRADEQADALEALKIENQGQSKQIYEILKETEEAKQIIIRLIDRFNKSDDTALRHREDMVKEINSLSDVMMEVKGSVSRINGKN